MEPIIVAGARKHGVQDQDMLHAFRHPLWVESLEDEFTMVIGPDSAGNLLEVGVVGTESVNVIVHAMPARPKYLR